MDKGANVAAHASVQNQAAVSIAPNWVGCRVLTCDRDCVDAASSVHVRGRDGRVGRKLTGGRASELFHTSVARRAHVVPNVNDGSIVKVHLVARVIRHPVTGNFERELPKQKIDNEDQKHTRGRER